MLEPCNCLICPLCCIKGLLGNQQHRKQCCPNHSSEPIKNLIYLNRERTGKCDAVKVTVDNERLLSDSQAASKLYLSLCSASQRKIGNNGQTQIAPCSFFAELDREYGPNTVVDDETQLQKIPGRSIVPLSRPLHKHGETKNSPE